MRNKLGSSLSVTLLWVVLLFGAAPGQAARVDVVQYFAYFDQLPQFLTSSPAEIRLVERDYHWWWRSGVPFQADDAPGPGLVPVCRFYFPGRTPSDRGRHFYTAFAEECEAVKQSSDWLFEGVVFYVRLPDTAGNCPAGTAPIYRVHGVHRSYDGAVEREFHYPAHVFTPYATTRVRWLATGGWVSEGYGSHGVAFCVPASFDVAQSRIAEFAGSAWELTILRQGSRSWYYEPGWKEVPLGQLMGNVSLGPVTHKPTAVNRWSEFDSAPGDPAYMAELTGTLGVDHSAKIPVHGNVTWSPFADKLVLELFLVATPGGDAVGFWGTFEYTGGDTVKGCLYEIHDFGNVGGWWLRPDFRICVAVTGRRLRSSIAP